jgi:regulator of chromosome condensation
MAGRRKVQGKRNKDDEYQRHLTALNNSFSGWVDDQMRKNPVAPWTAAIHDYLQYVRRLDSKYGSARGAILTFGSGDIGQLGHGVDEDVDLMVKVPRLVSALKDKHISQIACGGIHTAAITTNGQIFTWGCNDDGSLGRGGDENMPAVVEGIPSGEVFVQVVAGSCHSAALTVNGEVYSWGCYKDGDGKTFFHGEEHRQQIMQAEAKGSGWSIKAKACLIEPLYGVQEIACGSSFTAALCSSGELYTWGINDCTVDKYGACSWLGRPACPIKCLNDDRTKSYDVEGLYRDHLTPRKPELDGRPLTGVKCMGAGAYHLMIGVVVDGCDRLYTTGLNSYGQLGIGSIYNRETFARVETMDGVALSALKGGVHHSLALSSDGVVWGWGRGDSGQLGIVKAPKLGYCEEKPVRVHTLPARGTEISCGDNHCLVLTRANEVYSWGYGDMLALGNGRERDEPLPHKINLGKTGYAGCKILQLGGGGQHSGFLVEQK